ncbi:DUF6193 family natural product biosynthesis protein [Streptomyces sp. NPDC091371]|uniref:DUF6193 family natural product biosynthesis protein n=1 Tax=Streptomyces sp. NPDC091371 TaxID=3155303 RepID=UPI0034468BA9
MPEEPVDPGDPLFRYAEFYPEVVRAGSLRRVLQAAADRAGGGLAVELLTPPAWRHVVARARADSRDVIVAMTLGRRSFAVDCRAEGSSMARGGSADLDDAAGALRSWLLLGLPVPDLVAQWPFLGAWDPVSGAGAGAAAAAGSGSGEPGDAVSVRWRQMRVAAAGPTHAGLYELVEAAFAEPRLRALSPRTSHDWLRFSRRATAPLCTDLPMVRPLGNGRYHVRTEDGRLRDTTGTAETLALLLDNLPRDARD